MALFLPGRLRTGWSAFPRVRRQPIVVLHTVAALVVAAWTTLLTVELSGPARAEWLGYNVVLMVAMIVTARATGRATQAATTLSAVLSALVFADAWFDVTTAPAGYLSWSLLSAGACEFPFAFVCAYVAVRGFRPD